MTDLHRSLASNVKLLRNRLGWSQAELAEQAGLSISYVGDIEAGVKWPSAEKIELLARALHVKGYQFFLNTSESADYQDWLERRDWVVEMGEKLLQYFEKRRP